MSGSAIFRHPYKKRRSLSNIPSSVSDPCNKQTGTDTFTLSFPKGLVL